MSLSTMNPVSVSPVIEQLVRATGDMKIAEKTVQGEAEDRVRKETLLLDLNDDCLLKILSYLEKDDLVSVRLTNSRFIPLFKYTVKDLLDTLTVDANLLAKYPLETSMDVYRAIAGFAACVHFDNVTEKVVKAILPLAHKIEMLMLCTEETDKLKDLNAIETFPIPKSLSLAVGHTEKRYINCLMQRFGPSLHVLECSKTPRADPTMAPNINRLSIDGVWLGKKTPLWESLNVEVLNIRNQLESDEFHDFETVKRNLDLIAKKEMERMGWMGISSANLRESIIPEFNNITVMDLLFDECGLMFAVLKKIGPQLLGLTSNLDLIDQPKRGPADEMIPVVKLIADRFPDLRVLTLILPFNFEMRDMRPLYGLEDLRKLTLYLEPAEATFELVKKMPNLMSFDNLDIESADLVVPKKFTEYLKKEERSIVISDRQLP